MGVQDEFDRCHIVANIERFCSLYSIRSVEQGEGGDELAVTTGEGKKRGKAQQQQMRQTKRIKAEARVKEKEGEHIQAI